jgi:hypothetical protein
MKQKMLLTISVILSLVIITTACSSVKGIFGKSSSDEAKASSKIEKVEKDQNRNLSDKMDQVAILASGTGYALQKVTNKEPAVSVAYDINTRVESLAGKPNLDAEKEMWKTVDQLMSQVKAEREKGEKALSKKDQEISEIQDETRVLLASKDEAISKYRKMSQDAAMLADTRKAELDDYQGWFGLKAVGKGLWQFVTSMAWILGGMALLYFLLRAFAATNPAIGAIFSIVEQIAAGVIKLIQGLAPKAAQFASLIPKKHFDGYKQTLDKLVDTMELLKDNQKRSGKQYTLDEILNEFSKSMNDEDKARVDEVRKTVGWT